MVGPSNGYIFIGFVFQILSLTISATFYFDFFFLRVFYYPCDVLSKDAYYFQLSSLPLSLSAFIVGQVAYGEDGR